MGVSNSRGVFGVRKANKVEQEACAICRESFGDQRVAAPSTCEHYFCLSCLTKWAKRDNTCPMDRRYFWLMKVRTTYRDKVWATVPILSGESDDDDDDNGSDDDDDDDDDDVDDDDNEISDFINQLREFRRTLMNDNSNDGDNSGHDNVDDDDDGNSDDHEHSDDDGDSVDDDDDNDDGDDIEEWDNCEDVSYDVELAEEALAYDFAVNNPRMDFDPLCVSLHYLFNQ